MTIVPCICGVMLMCPPCATMMLWLTARPKPVPLPPDLVVKNGSKTRSRISCLSLGFDQHQAQGAENRALASEWISVEHSIGGLKRYRILSDRLRSHDANFYDQVLGVCAGLWNFYLFA